jgi:hypothetical protein
LRVWDTNLAGSRKRQRIKLAPADMPVREVQKIAEEKLRPVNQGLILAGSAMNFGEFVTNTYIRLTCHCSRAARRAPIEVSSRNISNRDSTVCVCVTSRG